MSPATTSRQSDLPDGDTLTEHRAVAPETSRGVEAAAGLTGNIDALGNGRVFGWAWSPADPQARLEVFLFAGDTELERGIANKARIDLRRNGVGDGAHAFDFPVPEVVDAPLRIVARHPSNGDAIELPLPGEDRAIEAVSASPFGIALDRLDFLIARHRQLQTGHRSLLKQLKELNDRFVEAPPGDAPLHPEIEGRLSEFDLVLDRVDRTLADFDSRLQVLARKNAHGVAPQLLILSVLVGALLGIALAAAFGA